jgi:hypothetical protein
MKEFFINAEDCISITIKEVLSKTDPSEMTGNEMMNFIKYGPTILTKTEENPKFLVLRNQLEDEGYIKTERAWWNGDTVLKPYKLNGKIFKKGWQFPCGDAIVYRIS